ncbi:bifunctional riboflavin kinase/FAD synthetase [Crassaminicella thermophila]|uniref:Riboflavin biosynthesis protein n=1 Tax=Crassaminicella thermophila TaxID=2599308 RepID=A0A5C0SG21_CRATE|nr:bifunctional riboflavin kinase/FAD synthetase [Crassaminicella thermophila]QEK12228.1 bifunctional riboflavin kinase/FAD synthetase [Crassaminicella thermophila]
MEVITSLENIEIDSNTGIALGSFDGVHIGHQALIVNLVDVCKKSNLKSVVYTFRNHPRNLTVSNGAPKRIITDKKKFHLLAELGVDYTVFIDFDDYQRTLSPEKFIKEILKDKFKMSYAVVGFNYRFGYRAQGDAAFLNHLKEKYSYDVMIVKAINIQDEVISSTKIREFISNGDIGKANLFLGRNYSIVGNVIHGKGLGKEFGFPTANIFVNKDYILPSSGVYFTKCIIDNKMYYSITNIGVNPTIGKNPISIETHIFKFDGDLYGKEIEILFFQKSRDEMKHEKIQDLICQINRDVQLAKKFFNI